MAVRIEMSGSELARVRFAMSPAYETVLALRVLRQPGVHAVHLPWARWARPRITGIPDLTLLFKVATGRPLKPAYLMPAPDTRMPDFAAELRRIRATPSKQLTRLGEDPRGKLARLADALAAVHDAVIAPHWTRMTRLLEADIAHRAGILARGGYESLFEDLHGDVVWTGDGLMVHPGRSDLLAHVNLEGRGLVMCPSVFSWPDVTTSIKPTGAGTLRYPARGVAALWEESPSTPDAVAALIGQTRAAILLALQRPATTSDLAKQLDVTSGAVSQHLGVLRSAGLVNTHRDGRIILHLRTDRGDALLR